MTIENEEDIYALADPESLQRALESILIEEAELDAQLAELLNDPQPPDTDPICDAVDRVQSFSARLLETIDRASSMADNLSAKVRQLDHEQVQVREALQQVESASEIRACFDNMQNAMDASDYARAAENLQQWLAYGADNIQDLYAQQVLSFDEDGSISMEEASRTVRSITQRLSTVCSEEFDRAVASGNDAAMGQFWRLFPLFGQVDVGLDKLTRFMVQKLRAKFETPADIGEEKGPSFVFCMSKLFEGIAMIVDSQEPVVREVYGPGLMLHVLRGIENESVLQFTKIFNIFNDKRQLSRHVRDIGADSRSSEQDSSVLRDTASLLDEMALMSQKVSTFQRFLNLRGTAEVGRLVNLETKSEFAKSLIKNDYQYSAVNGLLKVSEMTNRVREMMSLYYLPLESFYLSKSIHRALKFDSYQREMNEQVSSSVEDCFFIMKRVIMRSLGTQDIDTVCVILNLLSRVLEEDYLKDGLTTKMKSAFGGDRASTLADTSDSKIAFIILLNNMDLSVAYIGKLCHDIEENVGHLLALDPDGNPRGKEKVKSCLSPIQDSAGLFQKQQQRGIDVLFSQTCRGRVKQAMNESLVAIKLIMTEEEFALGDVQTNSSGIETQNQVLDMVLNKNKSGSFASLFTSSFDKLMADGFTRYLREYNLAALLGKCVDMVIRDWENYIIGSQSRVNNFGAMQFDKNVRFILTYLNHFLPLGTYRDKFLRLFSISTVLNLEKAAEIEDYDLKKLKLSAQEVKKLLVLRFGTEEASKTKIN